MAEYGPLSIVLFRGKDFVSDIISDLEEVKLGDGSWTHCGVLLRAEDLGLKCGLTHPWVIWESTSSLFSTDAKDVETDRHMLGVQIRDFDEVCRTYEGRIAVSKLVNPIPEEMWPAVRERLQALHKKYHQAFYDANCIDLLAALFPFMRRFRKNNKEPKWLFCSELAALIYQAAGLLPEDVNPQNVIPIDFVAGCDADEEIPADKLFQKPVLIEKVTRDTIPTIGSELPKESDS